MEHSCEPKLRTEFCQVGHEVCRIFSRICTILWKSLKIVEVHVWDETFGKLFADELTEWLIEEGFIETKSDVHLL